MKQNDSKSSRASRFRRRPQKFCRDLSFSYVKLINSGKFICIHINNTSGKSARKASPERNRTWMFLVTDPMNVISRNSLGGMCFFVFDSHEKSIAIDTNGQAYYGARSAAGPRHGGSLLCRRPSAWGFSPLPPALGHGLPSSAAGPRPWPCFQVFEFSSFRFFKFTNVPLLPSPHPPPPKYSQKRSWNVKL